MHRPLPPLIYFTFNMTQADVAQALARLNGLERLEIHSDFAIWGRPVNLPQAWDVAWSKELGKHSVTLRRVRFSAYEERSVPDRLYGIERDVEGHEVFLELLGNDVYIGDMLELYIEQGMTFDEAYTRGRAMQAMERGSGNIEYAYIRLRSAVE
jgi:hypothetical protein